jgi:hypothetical protein
MALILRITRQNFEEIKLFQFNYRQRNGFTYVQFKNLSAAPPSFQKGTCGGKIYCLLFLENLKLNFKIITVIYSKERGPLSLVRIIEELLEWKSSDSGLGNRD